MRARQRDSSETLDEGALSCALPTDQDEPRKAEMTSAIIANLYSCVMTWLSKVEEVGRRISLRARGRREGNAEGFDLLTEGSKPTDDGAVVQNLHRVTSAGALCLPRPIHGCE